jgi:hypothetical protein
MFYSLRAMTSAYRTNELLIAYLLCAQTNNARLPNRRVDSIQQTNSCHSTIALHTSLSATTQ